MSWGETAETLKQSILEYLGPTGTLLVPTFNWTFVRGYPIHMSLPGLISDYFRTAYYSTYGQYARFIQSSLSQGLVQTPKNFSQVLGNLHLVRIRFFERLLDYNVTILLINSRSDIAFVHYVEQQEQVSYRFMKYFRGDVFVGQKNIGGIYDFFTRRKKDRSLFNGDGLYKLLVESGAMTKYHTAEGYPVCKIKCRDCNHVLTDKLKKDPDFLRC